MHRSSHVGFLSHTFSSMQVAGRGCIVLPCEELRAFKDIVFCHLFSPFATVRSTSVELSEPRVLHIFYPYPVKSRALSLLG